MSDLPLRWIHLDFHTPAEVPEVGADFDPDAWVETLCDARVNTITVFARCHHGYCYYPSRVAPPHPTLKRDLLGEMIEAGHSADIQVNAYTTVCWDEHTARRNPGWRQVTREGRVAGRGPLGGGESWRDLCMNSPYAEYVLAQLEELVRDYPVDGVFLDIVRAHAEGCYCEHCMRSMLSLGLDPEDPGDVETHNRRVGRAFAQRATDTIKRHRPDALRFFNGRLRVVRTRDSGPGAETDWFTHWEIESLPSGGWGYNHFPLFARYVQTLGKPMNSHTGRFHLTQIHRLGA